MNEAQKVQEWRGIRGWVAAEVLADNEEEFRCDKPFPVAPAAELSRTTPTSSDTHFYDNVPAAEVQSVGPDEVAISAAAIPFDALAEITGQDYDEKKGMFVEGERKDKYFAIGYITEKTDGTEVYVWRLKGKFNVPDSVHKTKDSGTEANGQQITYKGIHTTHKFTVNGEKKTAKAVNVSQDVNPMNETEFFSEVQTPETVPEAV